MYMYNCTCTWNRCVKVTKKLCNFIHGSPSILKADGSICLLKFTMLRAINVGMGMLHKSLKGVCHEIFDPYFS